MHETVGIDVDHLGDGEGGAATGDDKRPGNNLRRCRRRLDERPRQAGVVLFVPVDLDVNRDRHLSSPRRERPRPWPAGEVREASPPPLAPASACSGTEKLRVARDRARNGPEVHNPIGADIDNLDDADRLIVAGDDVGARDDACGVFRPAEQ
jgi:hypothetical protein